MVPPPSDRLPPKAAWVLFLTAWFTFGYFRAPLSWNQASRFDLVRSIVERGRLDIDPWAANTADKAIVAGHAYSDKAPGAAFAAIPGYALYLALVRVFDGPEPQMRVLGRGGVADASLAVGDGDDDVVVNESFLWGMHVANLLASALAAAALIVAVAGGACALGASPRRALGCAACVGTGSLVLPYAGMLYGHVLAGAWLMLGWRLLDRDAGLPNDAAAGVALGAAVMTEYPAAAFALVILVSSLRDGPNRWRRSRSVFLGASLPLLVLAGYHTAAFGRPWRVGYGAVVRPEFEGMRHGLFGVGWPRPGVLLAQLIGRLRGLFYLAPVWTLATWGLVRGCRSAAKACGLAVLVATSWLLSAGHYMWWGGAALGPRHLIPTLPFLAMGLVFLPRTRSANAVWAALAAVSAANVLAGTAVSPEAPAHHRDLVFGYVWPHALAGRVPILPGATNLGLLLGLRGLASVLPLLLVWSMAAVALLRLTRKRT